jgi:hypothetical protein
MSWRTVLRFVRENGLTLAFLLLLLLAVVGELIAGTAAFNGQQVASGGEQLSILEFARSSAFAVDIAENWQSEYLQFALYIVATAWLVQKGSSESKPLGDEGGGDDRQQRTGKFAQGNSPRWAATGGLRTALYGWSLGAIMTFFFLASMLAESIAGRAAFNVELLDRREDPMTWTQYLTSSDFWNRSLQNWQSEFLAVASMAAFSIYLRQRGSPESKPVGASHASTGDDE